VYTGTCSRLSRRRSLALACTVDGSFAYVQVRAFGTATVLSYHSCLRNVTFPVMLKTTRDTTSYCARTLGRHKRWVLFLYKGVCLRLKLKSTICFSNATEAI
jgi:hypothetical protein